MSRLPYHIQEALEVEELYLPTRNEKNPVINEIVASINGVSDEERVELNVGGYVRIPMLDHEWLMVESVMERRGSDDVPVFYAELINRAGDMEVSLDANPMTGEITNISVQHRSMRGYLDR